MTIEELNEITRSPEADEFVRVCEARQVKEMSKIADAVCARAGVRLVLVAGASSAGKTTTAKRLCTQLRVNGRHAALLSTDDYFVGDRRNPRDETGDFDYEHVDCVDRVRLASDLKALMSGEPVRLRRFNFLVHEGYDAREASRAPADAVFVIEGIHALNPLLVENLGGIATYGVFAAPEPKIELFFRTTLASSDMRQLRRLVRDNQFRRMDPTETFDRWPKVMAGEARWIAPFRERADAFFDTGLAYELAVLKPYAAGLLSVARRKRPDNPRIEMYQDILASVHGLSPNAVPGDSILRETIGGSQLEY